MIRHRRLEELRIGDVVEVHWIDAFSADHVDYLAIKRDPKPYPHVTWGMVLSVKPDYIRILQTYSDGDGNQVYGIPLGAILEVIALGHHELDLQDKYPTPDEFPWVKEPSEEPHPRGIEFSLEQLKEDEPIGPYRATATLNGPSQNGVFCDKSPGGKA